MASRGRSGSPVDLGVTLDGLIGRPCLHVFFLAVFGRDLGRTGGRLLFWNVLSEAAHGAGIEQAAGSAGTSLRHRPPSKSRPWVEGSGIPSSGASRPRLWTAPLNQLRIPAKSRNFGAPDSKKRSAGPPRAPFSGDTPGRSSPEMKSTSWGPEVPSCTRTRVSSPRRNGSLSAHFRAHGPPYHPRKAHGPSSRGETPAKRCLLP